MKTIKDKSKGNNNTLDILDSIEEVKVSPFFKNKVLNMIEQEKEVKQPSFQWFSPQLQFASLVLIVCINAATIYYSFTNTETSQEQISGIESFVQEYQLDSGTNISIN
ncbi:MAG: hypothetical protein JKY02_09560 [Flavobacteriaceae bacterium]|nr:hypothetical protein [Flavobacteriaceae bacterium]